MGTPIINLPQTGNPAAGATWGLLMSPAVLGLHAIKDKAVAINGKIEIRPMMYLALTYYHRLLDGREAATFLVRVGRRLRTLALVANIPRSRNSSRTRDACCWVDTVRMWYVVCSCSA
jgi:pyruvate/2-oxoglutarate dehydrogenase complex dihydrolipoamide acyltransferase (E2) component